MVGGYISTYHFRYGSINGCITKQFLAISFNLNCRVNKFGWIIQYTVLNKAVDLCISVY